MWTDEGTLRKECRPASGVRSFSARDKWMVDHASGVIAVFNGTHGGTEYTIRYAREKGRLVDVINDAGCSEPQDIDASKTVR